MFEINLEELVVEWFFIYDVSIIFFYVFGLIDCLFDWNYFIVSV